MTARHASSVRSPRLALTGLLLSVGAVAGIFTSVGTAGADPTPPIITDPTGVCDPSVDPSCLLPTLSVTATDTATVTAIPTETATDTSTPSETLSIPDPTTALPTSDSATETAIPSAFPSSEHPGKSDHPGKHPSSSAAVPVGTLGTQDPNQDGQIPTGQDCAGLLCASSGYDAASAAAEVNAASTGQAVAAPTLAKTGSADRVTLQLSLGLLGAGLLMLAGGSRRLATAVGRGRARRRH